MSLSGPGTVVEASDENMFRGLLSGHPGGLLVVHMHADWAPQCAHMNEVLAELAKQHPFVTCVKVAVRSLSLSFSSA